MGDVQGIDLFQRISMACRDREPFRQRTGKPLGSGDADQPPAFVNLGGMVDSVGPQVVGNDPFKVSIQCGQRGGQLVGDAPEHLLHGVIEPSLDEAGRMLPDPVQFPAPVLHGFPKAAQFLLDLVDRTGAFPYPG